MPRVTVNVDEESEAWLEEEADRLNWSKADAGGECINLIQSAVGHIDVQQSDVLQDDPQYSDEVRDRLNELEQRVTMLEQGKVKEIRAETGVEPVDDAPTDSEGAHSGAVPVEGEDDPNPSPDASSSRGSPPDADDTVRERLRDELPGSGDLLAARVDAILAMRDELRDRGEATRDDLLDAVDIDATGYADANSLWKNTVAGRDTLRALDGVERPPTGRSTWKWVGDQEGGVYDPTEEF